MAAQASKKIQQYLEEIDSKIKEAYEQANTARKKGYDPETSVEIILAKNMAERVIGLIKLVAPNLDGDAVLKRIKKLEQEYNLQDWRVAFKIALETSQECFCRFNDKREAMEVGLRIGLAYITNGVVASPLEGFTKLKLRKRNDNGKEYFALFFSGPIRSAGTTATCVFIALADYIRKEMGYAEYDPTEKEVKRMVTELTDFHERVANLQYMPSEGEIAFMVANLPVQIDGDPSEELEVSNYRDIERIETNSIRDGICLVIGEGLTQKAAKFWGAFSKWYKEFGMERFAFLEQFVQLQKEIRAKGTAHKQADAEKIKPDHNYLKDLVAGRPIFTHPLRTGGFRLRYGRTRTSGYSSCAVHPATMHILLDYLATGTQLKMERPGKATAITACSLIEGPIVKLDDSSVVQVKSLKEAKACREKVKEVLFLGDILINYGDFFNRSHLLVPPGYCPEWWALEVERAIVNLFGALDYEKAGELTGIEPEELGLLLKAPLTTAANAEQAITISELLKVPLHPDHNYHWKTITPDQLLEFILWIDKAKVVRGEKGVVRLVLPLNEKKRIAELLGIPHTVVNNEFVAIEKDPAQTILKIFGKPKDELTLVIGQNREKDALEIVNLLSSLKMRDKGGVYIGARMGRPEKAKMRKLTGSPQVLFPVGEEGGRLRSFQSSMENGKITADFAVYKCDKCNKTTIYPVCEVCNSKTKPAWICKCCGIIGKAECLKHGKAVTYESGRKIEAKHYFSSALKKLGLTTYPDLIKGVRGTSNKGHIPEHLAKGILRAMHDIYVNKDGTVRYDMTQLPITHFKPKEIGTSVSRLIELGYTTDIHGKELADEGQVLELFPQDVILPACAESPDEGADDVLFRITKFVDDLLVKFYEMKPFYNLKDKSGLAGHIVLCLAPHTVAAVAARIVGFSKTQGFFAHPLVHAATRRDCDGDEACVTLLLDVLLNFSKHYLPAHRGSTQDSPLVLASWVIPAEVDDMVFDIDRVWGYPLEFYEACLRYENPRNLRIERIGNVLGTEAQYEKMGFTHDTDDINNVVRCSAYKTIPSMEGKLKGQMEIAEKVRAVDSADVARLVIEKHFLRDIKGNLRKFSMQVFRCVNCNEKYRRPPLAGKCRRCGGKIIFTISEGSVIKYLEPALSLARRYNLNPYLKQSMLLLQERVESIFGKEKERQEGLGKWFG